MRLRLLGSAVLIFSLAAAACGQRTVESVTLAEAQSICNEVGLEQFRLFVDWDSLTASQRGDIIGATSRKCEVRCFEDTYSPGDSDYDECLSYIFLEHKFVGEMENYVCTDSQARIALEAIWRTYLVAVSEDREDQLGVGFPDYEGYEGVCTERVGYSWGQGD
jgi:hypothetical protein